jgi:hypothetical protein
MPSTSVVVHAWQRRQFEIAVDNPHGRVSVDGICLASVPIGLHFRDMYGIDVTHLPSGKRLGKLTSLGAAMEFVHRVAFLCDWYKVEPEVPAIMLDILRDVEAGALRPKTL